MLSLFGLCSSSRWYCSLKARLCVSVFPCCLCLSVHVCLCLCACFCLSLFCIWCGLFSVSSVFLYLFVSLFCIFSVSVFLSLSLSVSFLYLPISVFRCLSRLSLSLFVPVCPLLRFFLCLSVSSQPFVDLPISASLCLPDSVSLSLAVWI